MSQEDQPWAAQIDLFSFTPVPKAGDVSTKKSRVGTFIFLGLFFAYFIFTFYSFIAVNTPRINQFYNPLDDDVEYDSPEMAFAFLRGDNLNESFYDPRYFYYKFEHVTIPQDVNVPRVYTEIPLIPCRPDWLQPSFDLLCPTQHTTLQGLLYGSPNHMYPRMKVSMCNNRTSGGTCETIETINWVLMTGRLFVFLKQYSTYNYATGSPVPDSTPYLSYYYFLIMDMYNRAEVKVQAENITILPDLFTSFSDQKIEALKLSGQNFYVSRVPTNISHSLFVWWCSMSESTLITTVAFTTLLDVLSDVGAIWGLLIAIFTLYFWEYNRNYYYSRRPEMTNFDEKISPFVNATENLTVASTKKKSEEAKAKGEMISHFLRTLVSKEIELRQMKEAGENKQEEEKQDQPELFQPLTAQKPMTTLFRNQENLGLGQPKDEYDAGAVYRAVNNPKD